MVPVLNVSSAGVKDIIQNVGGNPDAAGKSGGQCVDGLTYIYAL